MADSPLVRAGSHYLTSNLAVTSGDAIVISASNVTSNLNGLVSSQKSGGPVCRCCAPDALDPH